MSRAVYYLFIISVVIKDFSINEKIDISHFSKRKLHAR